MNIVEIITNQLGRDVVGKLGGLIGESGDKTQTAVGAAVPALLAGFSSLASRPEGAAALDAAVSNVDPGLPGDPLGTLGGSGSNLAQKGGDILGSLVGPNTLSRLADGLGSFLGLGEGTIRKLLGMLTPIVLGILGRQKSSLGLDAGGLGSFLAGQKQNILAAMPSGLGSVLGNVPGIGSFLAGAGGAAGAALGSARAGVEQAAGAVRTGANQVADAAVSTGSSMMKWVLVLIAIVVVLFLLSRMFGGRTGTGTAPATSEPVVTTTSPAALLTSDLQGITTTASEVLAGVTDSATAAAAVPRLRELSARLDGLKQSWDQLPTGARGSVSNQAKSAVAAINQAADKVKDIPGVGETVRPVVDELIAKLTAMSA